MTTTIPDVDLTDGNFYADGRAREHYRWMRANQPVFRDRNGLAAAASYQAVIDAERNPELFSNVGGIRPDQPGVEMMIEMDDPQHLLRRKLVNAGFTRKRVKDLETSIDSLCDVLIDAVCERGECDFVWDLAAPLPMAVIGDMLGVRPGEREMFLKWSDDMVTLLSSTTAQEDFQVSMDAFAAYTEYMTGMIEARKEQPTDDLVSVLVHAEVEGSRLEDHQIVTEVLLLLIGGDETTRHTLSGGTRQLLRHPDQHQRLVNDSELLPNAIEEMLRWTAPVENMARTITADTEFHRTALKEGEKVFEDPESKVDALARVLKGLPAQGELAEAFEITRSLPHGHVAAVLGTARRLGIEELIDPAPSRQRNLVVAMLIAQVITPGSKLAFARALRAETATSSLGAVLGVGGADEDDLYAAMDWALTRKDTIENALAARHLANGTLVLYDVSSAAFEGRCCPLGKIGHARDGVKGRLQIVYGLLCTTAGVPVAIEVFEGNTADPTTLAAQISKLTTRFGLARVCLVGDRGMLTSARIRDELRPGGLDWITALRAPQITALVEADALQLSLFDEQNLVEISSPDYPGERLVCCRNPALAVERARKRDELLAATATELDKIAAATRPSLGSASGCRSEYSIAGKPAASAS